MLGAGTTITRDFYVDTTQALQHPKVWNVNDWLYVVAADNTIRFYEIDPRDISIEAKTVFIVFLGMIGIDQHWTQCR